MHFNLAKDIKTSMFRAALPDEMKNEFDVILFDHLKDVVAQAKKDEENDGTFKNLLARNALCDVLLMMASRDVLIRSLQAAEYFENLTRNFAWLVGSDKMPEALKDADFMKSIYESFLVHSTFLIDSQRKVNIFVQAAAQGSFKNDEELEEKRKKERENRWKKIWSEDDAIPKGVDGNSVEDAWEKIFKETWDRRLANRVDTPQEIVYTFPGGRRAILTGDRNDRIEVDSYHQSWMHLSLSGQHIKGVQTKEDAKELIIITESHEKYKISVIVDDYGVPGLSFEKEVD